MVLFLIINFIVQVILKSQFKHLVRIIYTLQFPMALQFILFTTPAIADIFFEQFEFMYEFKFLNVVGFVQLFDKDFKLG